MLVAEKTCELSDWGMLGESLKKLRERMGLTQTDLAVKAGLSLSIIQKIEASKGDLAGTRPTHRAIAEALGMTLEDFDARMADDAANVSIRLPRELYERAMPFAEAQGIDGEAWVAAAVEALMRLHGSPEDAAKGVAGRIDRRDDGPPGHRMAGKPKKPKGK